MNINKLIEGQRREFNNEFGYRDLDFYDEYDGNDWEGASMVKPTGCNDCGKCQNARHAHREFMITQTKNTLIKFLDSEIKRLEYLKKLPFQPLGYIDSQIAHFHDIKKQLE